MNWIDVKEWLEVSTGLHEDALHIHAGLVCLVAAALLVRRPLASPIPWIMLLVLALANEAYDLHYERWPDGADFLPNRDTQIAESVKDLWNTMLVPTVLMLLCRFAPRILVGRRRSG